jgi:hypothetical protein
VAREPLNETFSLLEVEWIVISSTAYLRHDLGGPLYDDNFDDTIPVGRDLCLRVSKFPASEGMRSGKATVNVYNCPNWIAGITQAGMPREVLAVAYTISYYNY